MSKTLKMPTEEGIRDAAQRSHKKFSFNSLKTKFGLHKDEHCYVYGFTPDKLRPIFVGPLLEEQAEEIAATLLEGEIFFLDTQDIHKATGEIKAELLRRGSNPDAVLERMGHKHEAKEREQTEKRGLGYKLRHIGKKDEGGT